MARSETRKSDASLSSVRQWWQYITEELALAGVHCGHGCDNPRDEAAWLLVHTLHINHEALLDSLDLQVSAAQEAVLTERLHRRIVDRVPMAYVLEEAWLGSYRFLCDARALVPRSFLAPLLISKLAPWVIEPEKVRTVVDLGCGGGSLAILAAYAFPHAEVTAVDLSPDALALAQANLTLHQLSHRVHLMQGDLFSPLHGARFDVIISNPPYVRHAVMEKFPQEYRHEPALGHAGGKDGLDIVRRILASASQHLNADGWLVVEIGHQQAKVEKAFPRLPFIWQTENTVFCLPESEL